MFLALQLIYVLALLCSTNVLRSKRSMVCLVMSKGGLILVTFPFLFLHPYHHKTLPICPHVLINPSSLSRCWSFHNNLTVHTTPNKGDLLDQFSASDASPPDPTVFTYITLSTWSSISAQWEGFFSLICYYVSITEWNHSALGIYHLAPESSAMKTFTAQPNCPHLLNARATSLPNDRLICLLIIQWP